MRVIVASENPVKIKAVSEGFNKMFSLSNLKTEGVSVDSKVSSQPMSDEETFQGAYNRVKVIQKKVPAADYWVGIEGGCQLKKKNEMEAFAWVVVKSKNGKIGKGKTSAFFLPEKIINLIKQGKELGEADDIVFGQKNSKQKNGTIGNLTNNLIDRTKYYTEAVILALIPFKNDSLY